MARQGLNCTLSYERGGSEHTYRIRVETIRHGIAMVSEEAQARMVRAYYPHRVTTQRFYLGVLLKGYAEHKELSSWLMDYVSYAVDPDYAGIFRSMNVVIPSREFIHKGIPLAGYHWGDKVGKILWGTTLEFEAAYEPWAQAQPDTSAIDNLDAVYEKEKAAKYWYPEGIQLSGGEQPVDFDRIVRGFSDRWSSESGDSSGTSIRDEVNDSAPGGNVVPSGGWNAGGGGSGDGDPFSGVTGSSQNDMRGIGGSSGGSSSGGSSSGGGGHTPGASSGNPPVYNN